MHTNAVFFNLITPIQITASGISKSPQVRSFIDRSNVDYFPVHQPVATNSMHLQPTYTPHLLNLSGRVWIWNPVKHLRWCFLAEIVNVLRPLVILRPLAFLAEPTELHRGCLTEF